MKVVYLLLAFPVLDEHLNDIAPFEDDASELGEPTVQLLQLLGHLVGTVHRLRNGAAEFVANARSVNVNHRGAVLAEAVIVALQSSEYQNLDSEIEESFEFREFNLNVLYANEKIKVSKKPPESNPINE